MKHKRNWFLQVFSCCISKNASDIDSKYVSSSVQCEIQEELTKISRYGEVNFFPNKEKMLDLALYRGQPSSGDIPLENLDSSLNFDDNSHRISKNEEPMKDEVHKRKFCHVEGSGDVLQFSVSINSNTCIECLTRKGKNSLTICQETNCQLKGGNPELFLLQGDSEVPTSGNIESSVRPNSIQRGKIKEKSVEKVDELQKKYTMLSSNVGRFSSHIMKSLTAIKNDVDYLRAMLYKIGCVVIDRKKSASFRYSDVKNGFDCMGEICRDQTLLRTQEYKYIKAKMRASNFCRFYNLSKMYDKKKKSKNIRRIH